MASRCRAATGSTFRLDVTNGGGRDALDAEIWDPLPVGITCAMIDAISNGGTCGAAAGSRGPA